MRLDGYVQSDNSKSWLFIYDIWTLPYAHSTSRKTCLNIGGGGETLVS